MGFTYQELKRSKKNSIVLEKQENIEILQNSTGFSKTKRTFIRERFYNSPQSRCSSDNQPEKRSNRTNSKHKVDLTTVLKHSLIEEKDQQETFAQRVYDTCDQLANLEENINHEIEKLQEESRILLKNKQMETKKKSKAKYQGKGQGETWADHLAGNSCKERKRDQLEISKEKFSLQHQCICTSPCYADDKDLMPRPRKRSVASQMTTRRVKCLDQGAVGDNSSIINVKLKTEHKLREAKEMLKGGLQNVLPIITKNDHTVNCCYGIIDYPFCHCCTNSCKAAGNHHTCHHHKYQPIEAGNNREYTYCHDKHYYDCANYGGNSQCARCQKTATSTSHNRRQRTDLNTQHFYCRPTNRSCSPSNNRCDNNHKRTNKEAKSNDNNKESYAKIKQHSKREFEKLKEQTHKRSSSKSKHANEKRATKEEKLCKLLNKDKACAILKYFDRYVDDHEKELKLKECKTRQKSDNSYSASILVKLTREAKLDEVTASKTQQDSDATTEFIADYDDVSLSFEALKMLKQMKIHPYKPKKPKEKIDENKQKTEAMNDYKQQEKMKNFQRYLEEYAKENEAKKTIEVLKEPSKILEKQESEETDIFKRQQQQTQRSLNAQYRAEEDLKDYDFTAIRDETNLSHYQDSCHTFESNDPRDLNHFPYVEEPQDHDELRYEYNKAKGSVEGWNDQEEFKEKFNRRKLIEHDFLEGIKLDLGNQKHWTKDHSEYEKLKKISQDRTETYKESTVKEEKEIETRTRYDANKARDCLEKRQPEKNLSEDRYKDEIYQESREILKQPYRPHESEHEANGNCRRIKGSISYNSNIHEGSLEHAQYPIESLRERVLNDAKDEHDHKSYRESKVKSAKENLSQHDHKSYRESKVKAAKESSSPQYRCRTEENNESANDNEIERSLDSQSQIHEDPEAKDQQKRKTPDKEKANRPSPLESLRQQAKETLHSPESYRKQKYVEMLKLKEDDLAQLKRSARPKVKEVDYDKKENEIIIPKLTDDEVHSLKQKNENFLQEYDAQESNETLQNVHSYSDFKQVMDHSLGIFIHRSSQTVNDFKPELNGQISKQTFTQEVNPDHEIFQRPSTLEEALMYLKNFLKSYTPAAKEEQCLHSATSVANDLIIKLSSCKSLLDNQVLASSQEDFKEPTKSSEDKSFYTIEGKRTQDTQYKDPESTSDSSDLQFKQAAKEEEIFSVLAETSEIEAEIEKKEDSLILVENNKQEFESPNAMPDTEIANIDTELEKKEDYFILAESNDQVFESSHAMPDIEKQNIDPESEKNALFEQELYHLQTQVDSQQWQTSEIDQRHHQKCKEENLNSLKPLAEFTNSHDTPCDLIYKEKYCCCEPYLENEYIYRDLSSSSRQPVFDRNIMVTKEILKPCCRVENPNEGSCDLESYKTASVVSCNQKDHMNVEEGSIMNYYQEPQRIAQQVNKENMETILTKDLNSLWQQSNLKLTETTATQKQPICRDCQQETESVLEYYPQNSSSIPYGLEVPAFTQCPCMYETYVKMVTTFYKGKQKQLLIES